MPSTLGALASELGGVVDAGASDLAIAGVAPTEAAQAGWLTPVLSRRYVAAARASGAALLVRPDLAALVPVGARWVHEHAAFTLTRVLHQLFGRPEAWDARALAHVDPHAEVDPTAIIGPGAVIFAGAHVGPDARIEPNAVVYGNVTVGNRAVIGAGSVIGRPGFGWVASPKGDVVRMPQLGGVVIEADAEIGPLATVDAGTLGPTVIGRGAKLDAHVHVGHNTVVGPGALVAAQAGFAGSVEIGAGVRVGGQAGVADHVHIGDGAELAAKAGVIGDVAPGATVAGYPAVERTRWLRGMARALRDERRGRTRR